MILGQDFVLTKGLDACLFVYPNNEWEVLEQEVKSPSLHSKTCQAFIRFFFAVQLEVEMDRQGRILIPPHLRDHAHIEKDAVIIGVSSRVEIWSLKQWEAYSAEAALSYEDIAEKLDLGI